MAFVRYWWITKLSLLLLVISLVLHVVDARPARGSSIGDLIDGNEFLKLFMERSQYERSFHSAEYEGREDAGSSDGAESFPKPISFAAGEGDDKNADEAGKLKTRHSARSLSFKAQTGGNTNRHTNNEDDNGKQVVKLVTSGSKIVFLEEYDDVDDAIVDALARDIDLKREKVKKVGHKTGDANYFYQESKSTPNDEFKVVAVSVSSSSKRGSHSYHHQHHPHSHPHSHPHPHPSQHPPAAVEMPKQVSKFTIKASLFGESETDYPAGSSTTKRPFKIPKPTTTTTTASPPLTSTTAAAAMTTSGSLTNDIDDFINRSHKSEFSIEEAEPLTMPQKQHKMRRAHAATSDIATDSQNSASTNVQNVLASPMLIPSASLRSSSIVPAGSNKNSTQPPNPARQARINQSGVTYDNSGTNADANTDAVDGGDTDGNGNGAGAAETGDTADLVEEKLLPFQTVIYHDTKEGHGPQSRSISYSSISQNADDLQTWQRTGILAEARRNVSESLKPVQRATPSPKTVMLPQLQTQPQDSGPSKFYSVPSKSYSVPSKFYSEPSKVYSQPAKVYGEPEKFYSQPSKVYGQPSKFYSEPSKVYSQPSKVYGEPAKTYWPQTTSITTTTTSTSTTTTTMTPASKSIITTFSPFASPFNLTARRPPAIVSRIAFGEAQSSSPPSSGYNHQHTHQNPYQSHKGYQDAAPNGNGQNTQPRRVLFNLDKLPYDLLNAPQQHLLEPDFLKNPLDPCAEPSSSSNAQQQQQHLRQHSSLSDQHSNQNAKGLPTRDLVKCVTKFSAHHPPASSSPHHHFTTERSHIEEVYRPTPEQNYEVEESVSVMTNGRAHGVQGGLGRGIALGTSTASPPSKVQATRSRLRPGGVNGPRTFGHAKSNTNSHDNGEEHDVALVHQSTKANQNSHHHYQSNNNDYNEDNGDSDDDGGDDGGGGNDDGDGDGDGGDDSDDAKVAYVVEGRNYRKYRVEEKTDDGFIVGEFGVVDHNDGNLRGVRYTADSTINPSLIQKALLTFLKLK